MEFVETPTFWCPHVDPTACTNFSTRTVERQPPETWEIFLFPFLPSPFPSFSLYGFFPFFFLLSFLFLPFCFSILFLFSHLISLSLSLHFLFSLFISLFQFGEHLPSGQRRKLPPHFLKPKVWLSLFHIFLLFHNSPFMTSCTQVVHCEPWDSFPHMANCEPFIQVDHMALPSVTFLGCHVASPYLAKCHSTPHASKNVKSRLPRNPTKFDVVAKFSETISTEKSVSSSKI